VVGVAATVANWPFVVGLVAEAFATLYTWLTVDCDGPVAVDQVAGPRYLLDEWLDQNGETLKFDRSYPGTDSPEGGGLSYLAHHRTGCLVVSPASTAELRRLGHCRR
jgi:hypothetical protein